MIPSTNGNGLNVHFEKELTPSYHREIKSKKNAVEIGDVFIETCFKLLEKVDVSISINSIFQIVP